MQFYLWRQSRLSQSVHTVSPTAEDLDKFKLQYVIYWQHQWQELPATDNIYIK